MRWQTQERYLRQMLARQLDIPILGKIVFAVASGSATSAYEEYLRREMDIPAELLFSGALAPLNAYNSLSAYRNDVMLVFPGAYLLTAELAWAKVQTHMVGMGGPNIGGDFSESNTVLYTQTADVASVLTVTGQYSQFHNLVIENDKDDADNLTAATIAIYGTRWKNVAFHGHMEATQNTTVAAASLYITGAGMYPLLEDCIIGQSVWGIRSGALSGVLRFTSAGRPNGGIFKRCKFLSYSNTVTCAMIAVPTGTFIGRDWNFEQCSFRNDNPDYGTKLNQVFYLEPTGLQKNVITLKDCAAFGFDAWDDGNAANILSDMAVPAVTGGLGIEPT